MSSAICLISGVPANAGSIASRLVRVGKVADRQSAYVANLHHPIQNKDGPCGLSGSKTVKVLC
jgi:hypothetical protein